MECHLTREPSHKVGTLHKLFTIRNQVVLMGLWRVNHLYMLDYLSN